MVTEDLEVLGKDEQPEGARAGDNKLQGPDMRKDTGWPKELGGEGVEGIV